MADEQQRDSGGVRGGRTMHWKGLVAALCGFGLAAPAVAGSGMAGAPAGDEALQVLPPIVRGNLAIFPVTGSASDASGLLTLDEGVRSGQVVVTEAGDERGLVRPGQAIPPRGGAEVNRLVLYNNSSKPLLLLAGEIVTGGKQDRVIAADRIVPAGSGPIDLGVFCVEPGRWVASSDKFGSMGAQMAQPSVRMPAMAERDQQKVWQNVRASNARVAETVTVNAAPMPVLAGTTSYAKVFASAPVAKAIEGYGGAEGEQAILRQLKEDHAIGVVVAVNGTVGWADVFASTELLAKYWPKLMRSYVAEAMTSGSNGGKPELSDAEQFITTLGGGREVAETESGVFRRTEISGDGYKVFELRSLLPKAGFVVHLTKLVH